MDISEVSHCRTSLNNWVRIIMRSRPINIIVVLGAARNVVGEPLTYPFRSLLWNTQIILLLARMQRIVRTVAMCMHAMLFLCLSLRHPCHP